MTKTILISLLVLLVLSACITHSSKESSQQHAVSNSKIESVSDSNTYNEFYFYKQGILDDIGVFDRNNRFHIYESIDEVANRLDNSSCNKIKEKKLWKQVIPGKTGTLSLSDCDGDEFPDKFAFFGRMETSTMDYGFIFDLNKDNESDYVVFNGGLLVDKDRNFLWMNYHWIDSNYDGKIDIMVNNAVNFNPNIRLPMNGLSVWLYDNNFDGYTDAADYFDFGAGIAESVPIEDGSLMVNWLLDDKKIVVGSEALSEVMNPILSEINAFISEILRARSIQSITDDDELSYWLHNYYREPRPDLVESALKYVSSSELINNPDSLAPIIMFFSCIFDKYDEFHKGQWRKVIYSLEKPSNEVFSLSINRSPEDLLNEEPISPTRNDMNWACFFATGDSKYLSGIIEVLVYLQERNNLNLYSVAWSAKWSLCSNAKSHPRVRVAIEEMLGRDPPEMQQVAEDILRKDPQEIKEEAKMVIKMQRDQGIWN